MQCKRCQALLAPQLIFCGQCTQPLMDLSNTLCPQCQPEEPKEVSHEVSHEVPFAPWNALSLPEQQKWQQIRLRVEKLQDPLLAKFWDLIKKQITQLLVPLSLLPDLERIPLPATHPYANLEGIEQRRWFKIDWLTSQLRDPHLAEFAYLIEHEIQDLLQSFAVTSTVSLEGSQVWVDPCGDQETKYSFLSRTEQQRWQFIDFLLMRKQDPHLQSFVPLLDATLTKLLTPEEETH